MNALSCVGIRLGKVEIPEFSLPEGGIVTMCWPGPKADPETKRFVSAVTGGPRLDGVTPASSFVHASWALTPSDLRIKTVLTKLDSAAAVEFESLLRSRPLSLEAKLEELPGGLRKDLQLRLAMTMGTMIVFDLSPLDPVWKKRIWEMVRRASSRGFTFLHLRFPLVGEQAISSDVFGETIVVSLLS